MPSILAVSAGVDGFFVIILIDINLINCNFIDEFSYEIIFNKLTVMKKIYLISGLFLNLCRYYADRL